ncbi:hypothetical protein [Halonatronum saccharophilum]|uniref:hypothetical protein n=1 Tax=Halonatronum saccharophilum TaxID=150060 RepID=UPI0004847A6B|nr:hypothetical protein [Halonatronum saccharophilum]
MAFPVIKKIFFQKKKQSNIISKDLLKLLVEEEKVLFKNLVVEKSRKLDIMLWLSALYLFNFTIIRELNDISIKSQVKNNVFENLSISLASRLECLSEGNNKEELLDLLNKRTNKFLRIYQANKTGTTKDRLRIIAKELSNNIFETSKENFSVSYQDKLFNFSTRNMTIIQDLLIARSVK